jgi:hypothetical protein
MRQDGGKGKDLISDFALDQPARLADIRKSQRLSKNCNVEIPESDDETKIHEGAYKNLHHRRLAFRL